MQAQKQLKRVRKVNVSLTSAIDEAESVQNSFMLSGRTQNELMDSLDEGINLVTEKTHHLNADVKNIQDFGLRLDETKKMMGKFANVVKSYEDAIQSVIDEGGKPYGIPAGASVHKFGGLGYVGFAEEVRQQEKELGFKFDYIIVCVVTGSTQAGMIVGFAEDNRANKVIGIDASGTYEKTRNQVKQIVNNTAELVELGREIKDEEIIINPDYAYPAYGVPSDETNDAIRLAAKTEGLITDPVYEGKSMQGLIDLAKKNYFPEGSKILYAHLGGAPALNGYSYYYKDG